MPNDTEFTLSLFDNTALTGWTHHTLQAVSEPDEGDETDTDEDGDTPASPAAPAPRGSNFHLAGDRELARGWSRALVLPSWRRIASAAPARMNSAPAGRRSAQRSKPPLRRRNMPPCNAQRSMPTTRRRQSSVDSGEPPNGWDLAGAACWNPAWAPACSSPCCLPRCTRPASSPASNTTRSPPASPAWCIPRRGCGARTTRGANCPGALIW